MAGETCSTAHGGPFIYFRCFRILRSTPLGPGPGSTSTSCGHRYKAVGVVRLYDQIAYRGAQYFTLPTRHRPAVGWIIWANGPLEIQHPPKTRYQNSKKLPQAAQWFFHVRGAKLSAEIAGADHQSCRPNSSPLNLARDARAPGVDTTFRNDVHGRHVRRQVLEDLVAAGLLLRHLRPLQETSSPSVYSHRRALRKQDSGL